ENNGHSLNQDVRYATAQLGNRIKLSFFPIVINFVIWLLFGFDSNIFIVLLITALMLSYAMWWVNCDRVDCYRFDKEYLAIKSYEKSPHYVGQFISGIGIVISVVGVFAGFIFGEWVLSLISLIFCFKGLVVYMMFGAKTYTVIPFDSIVALQLSYSQDKLRVIEYGISCIHDKPKGVREDICGEVLHFPVEQVMAVFNELKTFSSNHIELIIDIDKKENYFDEHYYQVLREKFNNQYPRHETLIERDVCAEHGVVLGGESPLRAQSKENR
ncbi:hypothetical protein L4C36_23515, partial [Photobacterium japonica]|uniref:hypothetical protein n=1 Tax=Photobacterium japonica TaxID=2910235 RepID=UPI003D140E3B